MLNAPVHQLMIHEIFDDIATSANRAEAAEKLKNYNKNLPPQVSLAMRNVLKGALDPRVIWRLPTSRPKFRPCESHDFPVDLVKQTQKFLYLIDGTQQSINLTSKREKIFLEILESVHPKDAEIVINMVLKTIDYKHVTATTVRQAFGMTFFEDDKKGIVDNAVAV